MISLDQLKTEQLVSNLAAERESAEIRVAYEFADRVLLNAYSVAKCLCKKQKLLDIREVECKKITEFVGEAFVDYCELDRDFIGFVMRHVRDSNIELGTELGRLYERFCEYDYSNTVCD